ncbi:hypothetical protein PV328_010381 [Microctonus aethiopoides]|uniref:Uncharacterized protein n=1 Tax=Microctonus aethiopoides TaxID=144406 RepID=A0AA39FHL7_9HYME|nr:hypothetical protein PV328_010381 [Microctonus aethiopoides]
MPLEEIQFTLEHVNDLHKSFTTEHAYLEVTGPTGHLDHDYMQEKYFVEESNLHFNSKRKLVRVRSDSVLAHWSLWRSPADPTNSRHPKTRLVINDHHLQQQHKRKLSLCHNFRGRHATHNCKSSHRYKVCNDIHHTLLYLDNQLPTRTQTQSQGAELASNTSQSH